MRHYVKQHPGRYAAGNRVRRPARTTRSTVASGRMLAPLAAVLRGYGLDPEQDVHALRMLRSALHGFATLEVEGGFRFDTDVDESFAWTVGLLDRALHASREVGVGATGR